MFVSSRCRCQIIMSQRKAPRLDALCSPRSSTAASYVAWSRTYDILSKGLRHLAQCKPTRLMCRSSPIPSRASPTYPLPQGRYYGISLTWPYTAKGRQWQMATLWWANFCTRRNCKVCRCGIMQVRSRRCKIKARLLGWILSRRARTLPSKLARAYDRGDHETKFALQMPDRWRL
ncbi:hypothetical protein PV10_06072 [Exophiala mesophila]|uniref:Uncharacterized protein n=1 Tax=Exophiala mesophila TaxID=212818 RepID=A0A0D1ZXL8_EXOME|nr:uncharacterized protein PV10_06072 [Exophiala mesophila]KIV91543.1 hypothetical protein PV10_06072 [Exophiala mesophila]